MLTVKIKPFTILIKYSAYLCSWEQQVTMLQVKISIYTKKGSYTNQYSCKHVGNRVNLSWAIVFGLCEHDFGLSLSSFGSTKVPEV